MKDIKEVVSLAKKTRSDKGGRHNSRGGNKSGFDAEINRVSEILTHTFSDNNDKKYWENKLRELKNKKSVYDNNQKNARSYEKGVKAYRQ